MVLIALLAGGTTGIWLFVSRPQLSGLPPLKAGDIVFQTLSTSQTLAILYATESLYSHMGIISFPDGKTPHVIEANWQVREIPFTRWIDQGVFGRIAIMRNRNLSAGEQQTIVDEARTHLRKEYDFSFFLEEDKIYCSELLFYAYRDAGVEPVGTLQAAGELKLRNSMVQSLIRKRWKNHPACQDVNITFNDCYAQLLHEPIITPASIAHDPQLEVIYSNYWPW